MAVIHIFKDGTGDIDRQTVPAEIMARLVEIAEQAKERKAQKEATA